MARQLEMSEEERRRSKVLEMVVQNLITLKRASEILQISYKQAKRIKQRYLNAGDQGLIHKGRGKQSVRKIQAGDKKKILDRYKERYPDFGPTFAAEKLAEEGLRIDHETLRRWLLEEGLWKRKRRRTPYRSRRDRRDRFGSLVQFDGSHHSWFEDRGERCCLMNMVDDATGITYSIMTEQETTEAAMYLLWKWIERYGIPESLYCDRKNAFVTNREPTIDEQLQGLTPKTPFETACGKLGIEIITANSPQAKGRVERNHAVYQDRFVKELRLNSISTIVEANTFLEKEYLDKINAKFSKAALDPQDAHVLLEPGQSLKEIFCFEDLRIISKDFVIMYERRLFQISSESKPLPRPRDKVIMRKLLDGTIHILWRNQMILFDEIILQKPKNSSQDFTDGDIFIESN